MARHSEGPWFRKSKNTWYITHDGRNVSLGVRGKGNREEAVDAWKRLLRDRPKVRKKAGVKAIAYGYRHTFATDGLASGLPEAHVAELLGHGSTAMLHKRYAHLTAKAGVLRNAAALVRPAAKPDATADETRTISA